MTQKSRDKEYWLIPKRANLHQSVYLLKGIVELGYNNRAWNTSKQDRLGSYLGKNGSTNSGKNIRPQSLRTLFASIPQFFGLAYIDTNTTPDTIVVTKCGLNLIEEFSDYFESYNCSNLRESEKENLHISSSKVFTQQFIKLQITNPIILKEL
ncbi:MAG: hypothetical protein OXC03_05115 [Flavobacteriaceae bacterium]|nr:hypothetical protein [Flavobacteriaceae bacterium]